VANVRGERRAQRRRASIDNADVTAVSIDVRALEIAFIQANAEVNVEASGGSFYGSGTVLAVNGQPSPTRCSAARMPSYAPARSRLSRAPERRGHQYLDYRRQCHRQHHIRRHRRNHRLNSVGWQSQNLRSTPSTRGPLDDYDYLPNAVVEQLNQGDRVKVSDIVYWHTGTVDENVV
jgi:hypothetical protein